MVKLNARFASQTGQGENGGSGRGTAQVNKIVAPPKHSTRIQRKKRREIIEAALEVFSAHGFRGATVDAIAGKAGMSKPNLLYYFPSKEAIYVAVLEDTLAEWLQPLADLNPDGEPIAEIGRYIKLKLDMSRKRPEASKLFANEILHGAPAIGGFLRGPLKTLVDEKAAVIAGWVAAGRIAAVHPYHLVFTIWAVTQHYADFDVQVRAVLGDGCPDPIGAAEPTILSLFLKGLGPGGAAGHNLGVDIGS